MTTPPPPDPSIPSPAMPGDDMTEPSIEPTVDAIVDDITDDIANDIAEDVAENLDEAPTGFTLTLENFSGPFDLLLQLISKHKLDICTVALHHVAGEFITYVTALDNSWDLQETSEFLLIAATLLDLKCARLLPKADVEDEEDLALLEARDLLFARLLQYKAFKEAANYLAHLATTTAGIHARNVGIDERYRDLLPPLEFNLTPTQLAQLAGSAHEVKLVPTVGVGHIHAPRVSVREHAIIISRRLQKVGTATFEELTVDCESHLEVVARFLALLELYREALVGFEQQQALGELVVRWIGGHNAGTINVDEYSGNDEMPDESPDNSSDDIVAEVEETHTT